MERVAVSRYIGRSARLRSLLVYLCDQVLERGAREIHEQEVGHAVFGRPSDYDTNSDNIVRVHASMLRKRLEQYFSSEGRDETIVIELPKGNYAPAFVQRRIVDESPVLAPVVPVLQPLPDVLHVSQKRTTIWLFASASAVAALVLILLVVRSSGLPSTFKGKGNRQGLWSQIFNTGPETDIVLDDEGVGLYQELTGNQISLSDYFNRNYLRGLSVNRSNQRLSQDDAGSIVLKRQSSYASAFLLWKLGTIAAETNHPASVHFARDYSFRELQSNNAVLIGNAVSNPWVGAFQDHIGFEWKYDPSRGAYYPVDTLDRTTNSGNRFRSSGDGYASVAVLPNLSGTGMVLILSSSGGAALGAAFEFLGDNGCIRKLTNLLPHEPSSTTPYFEALLRVKSRSRLTRDVAIMTCRKPRA